MDIIVVLTTRWSTLDKMTVESLAVVLYKDDAILILSLTTSPSYSQLRKGYLNCFPWTRPQGSHEGHQRTINTRVKIDMETLGNVCS